VFQGPAEAILVDGWCMGAREPLEPIQPAINTLERDGDPNTAWRRIVCGNLAAVYQPFFAAFDAMIYLQAPSWEIVRAWRGQQEEETLGRALTPEENAALDRFVMHYERITRSMLAGDHMAKWIVHLDEARKVVRVEGRE
jgi:D-glycerate 3-kinase